MSDQTSASVETFRLPETLPLLRARVTLRLLEATTLPAYKGSLLRGGFGYAFQQTCCPTSCWNQLDSCTLPTICPFRWVFATPHPPDVRSFHDLRDVPRPFVIEPPEDGRRSYAAGDALEFQLILIGRSITYLPYFFFGFERLGQMGLGRDHARARLERVEALDPWQAIGQVIYQDGKVIDTSVMPYYTNEIITARAAKLPSDLQLTLHTPLRLKARGDYLTTIDLPAIIQGICWRLSALNTFHGDARWSIDHRALVDLARPVRVENTLTQWVDWERTSTRHAEPQRMKLGGIIGRATLRDVPPSLRTLLLAGSLVHIGKACVFGHGRIEIR